MWLLVHKSVQRTMAFPSENGGHYSNHYTADEAELVDKAKRVHRETTASAQRAQKVSLERNNNEIWTVFE